MFLISIKTVGPMLIFAMTACAVAVAVCPVDEVIVRGRVVHQRRYRQSRSYRREPADGS
jgi:hypothetical protein